MADGGLRDLRSLWWLPIALQIGAIVVTFIFAIVIAIAGVHQYARAEQAEKERADLVKKAASAADERAHFLSRIAAAERERAELGTKMETQDVWLHNNDRRMERLLTAIERSSPESLVELRDSVVKEIRAEIYAERQERLKKKE
jgi:hypothetical protein